MLPRNRRTDLEMDSFGDKVEQKEQREWKEERLREGFWKGGRKRG